MPDLDSNLQTLLVEEYTFERGLNDSEIYVKIKEYKEQGLKYFAMQWWKLLYGISIYKFCTMKQVIKNKSYRNAFDIFRKVPALRGDIMLSIIYKIFAMRYHEVRFILPLFFPYTNYIGNTLLFRIYRKVLEGNF